VRRHTYPALCQLAARHGVADIQILSSTDTEYEVEMVGSPDAIDNMRRVLIGK
jgi:hypothetical protein